MCLYIFEILKLKSNYKNNVNIFILKIAVNKKIKKNKLLLSFTLLKNKGLNFTYHSHIFHMPEEGISSPTAGLQVLVTCLPLVLGTPPVLCKSPKST